MKTPDVNVCPPNITACIEYACTIRPLHMHFTLSTHNTYFTTGICEVGKRIIN